jgi:superfamily II DNA or RNA helicase
MDIDSFPMDNTHPLRDSYGNSSVLTPFHSKYLAHELTKRVSADNAEKLSQSLSNATVELNPHQVDAALFAFRSPLSRGAILADEVGLGKTIEAGLIISQLWAERKRSILCLVPAALRKQWNRELTEKFFIDSLILESRSYKEAQKNGNLTPFRQENKVVICSYQFASSHAAEILLEQWDLVVIDEAHRLRNVYKKSSKIARILRDCVGMRPKVLLTATPLQNSLMELFGLISFIDDKIFGSEVSFREQFTKGSNGDVPFDHLKERIETVCKRTLRRQVIAYVRYTNRNSFTQDFTPTNDEQLLYSQVSEYLQKPTLIALPSGQRQLITLVLRKILASSSFAIGATLNTMIERLEKMQKAAKPAATGEDVTEVVGDDIDHVDELEEEWDETDEPPAPVPPDAEKVAAISKEIEELRSYWSLAKSIRSNAKGEALLLALQKGFENATALGTPHKALIFTESRRTQLYLLELLQSRGYQNDVVIFNGTNSDPDSKRIYKEWVGRHQGQDCISGSPSADMRSALVDEFRDRASIMIATESAAEGVNLQFCNVVVNYDLPWNPQRIEQRIGRCHRWGQQHDVVVINFLNRANAADLRVFQLLQEKFKLFDGVFGASDEVLGALESGVDFEKRISEIYQSCRSTADINTAFDKLQQELEGQIQTALRDAANKIFENFDEEVGRKLRLVNEETKERRNHYSEMLWRLTQAELGHDATFGSEDNTFVLTKQPPGIAETIPLGTYCLKNEKPPEGEHLYRVGHPLAQALITTAKARVLPPSEIVFDCTQTFGRISQAEQLKGKSGWLRLTKLTISALEIEEHLIFTGHIDDGELLDHERCQKLMQVSGEVNSSAPVPADIEVSLRESLEGNRKELMGTAEDRNKRYFEMEMDKLERWSEDLKNGLEFEIKELGKQITETKRDLHRQSDLQTKLDAHKRVKELERSRLEKRKSLFEAQDKIDADKDDLIVKTEAKLKQQVTEEEVFTIRWRVQ